MVDERMIHVPGRTEQDDTRVHHATQVGAQFRTYKLSVSGIFHLLFQIIVDHRELKPQKAKPWIRGDYCNAF